jgi:Fe-S cluster assembly protein SufD
MSTTVDTIHPIEAYLEASTQNKKHPLADLQSGLDTRVLHDQLPIPKHEEWKYTSLKSLYAIPWAPQKSLGEANVVVEHLQTLPFYDADKGNHLVFVNGVFRQELSHVKHSVKSVITSTHSVVASEMQHLGSLLAMTAPSERDALRKLNNALLDDGLYVRLVPGETAAAIHVYQFTIGEESIAVHPRTVVHVGQAAEVSVVEYYAHLGIAESWFNPTTLLYAEQDSRVKHTLLQTHANLRYYTGQVYAHLEQGAVATQVTVTTAGKIIRNNLDMVLNGSHLEGNMYGLYMLTNDTHADNHTLVDHTMPHAQSNELYKGLLDGKSTGVFNGKIFVRQDAQKTNAYQSNRNLLLSPDATVDTKPQLEIFADDVKCSHGATTGRLDEEALFYLRSRGIGQAEAKALLSRAFAHEIVEKIDSTEVQEYLDTIISERFALQ